MRAPGINLAFSGRRAREISEQAEAKTRKHQAIRKRTEAAFIVPMQCKPVTSLPADEKLGPLRSNSTAIAALPSNAAQRSRFIFYATEKVVCTPWRTNK